MSIAADRAETRYGPWNPGLSSQIPRELRHLVTLFRSDVSFADAAQVDELRDLTGLDCAALVRLTPQRLALHEMLIRVTADYSVPDGERIEDLGINFRGMVRALLAQAIAPHAAAIDAAYDALRRDLAQAVRRELEALAAAPVDADSPAAAQPARGLRRFFQRQAPPVTAAQGNGDRESRAIAGWEALARSGPDPVRRAACAALARVASALVVRHGSLWGGRELIAAVATDVACNEHGAEAIGDLIEPWLEGAAAALGYVRLPPQSEPVVMNTKGASASGKSTLRPLQKRLAADLGVAWSEFALISPDIWRKQLLDYATLGDAYKYGGAFTGEELAIIDGKLDRYMARKAKRGVISHLLIDRFRFDSFAPDSDEAGSNLLTRFGRIVYLFFMITPPEALVERAWKRGHEVGRYKAVDDTLAHGVAAYSGMPELFFTWVSRPDKRVHFEFLDNSVAFGQRPRTVAFGWNDVLYVLDVKSLLDVERFRRVDVDAKAPERLYPDKASLAAAANTGFLRQCVARFREVHFAERASGRTYLRIDRGRPAYVDREALEAASADADTCTGILAVLAGARLDDVPTTRTAQPPIADRSERRYTLGDWGPEVTR